MNDLSAKPDHMIDAKGRSVPIHLVAEEDILKDQTITTILKHADHLSEVIARFKGRTFDDVYALQSLLAERYGARLGGAKGNIDLVSFDGCRKVQISIADHVSFGPELQIAKSLIDECIEEWSEGSRDEIRALVAHAFETDKPGHINREGLFSLRRMEIKDPKWQQAMTAIGDSMRVIGSKAYVRIYKREKPDMGWEMVQLNIAAV